VSLGCGGRESSAQRLERAYESAGMNPVTAYPLGGKITVDNELPAAKSETAFEFPLLPPGKFVMLFAQLGYNPRMGFFGPDGLKNLYNDPDVNSQKPEFLIDHQAPGRTDC